MLLLLVRVKHYYPGAELFKIASIFSLSVKCKSGSLSLLRRLELVIHQIYTFSTDVHQHFCLMHRDAQKCQSGNDKNTNDGISKQDEEFLHQQMRRDDETTR